MENHKKLFTQLFKPKKLEDFVLPDRIINAVKNGVSDNMLFYGTQGIGKSELAKFLADGSEFMYINASEDGRMDILRTKISDFCATISLSGKKKIILFDEIDGVSQSFFDALKGFMDQYSNNVRFIATSNYINKIPDPVRDRFTTINFNTVSHEEDKEVMTKYTKRVAAILNYLKIKYDNEVLKEFVLKNYPSFRSVLKQIQLLYVSGIKELDVNTIINTSVSQYIEIYEMIVRDVDPVELHKKIHKYHSKVNDFMVSLDRDFIPWLLNNHSMKSKFLPDVVTTIADYQYKMPFVIDTFVCLKACVMSLNKILK